MYKRLGWLGWFIVPLAMADSAGEFLLQADRFRLPEGPVVVETKVELFKDDQLDKERLYDVYIKPDHRSLVEFKSAADVGQKVLMVDKDYWMVLANSRRPVKITPTQKLLGEASTGDIATMTWAEEYDGTLADGIVEANGSPCIKLDLTSHHAGSTYDRIELYLAAADRIPVKANLFLKSGKLAKEAWFGAGQLGGQRRIVSMTLFDRIKQGQKTVVHYLNMRSMAIPDKFFNPAFLVNSRSLEP